MSGPANVALEFWGLRHNRQVVSDLLAREKLEADARQEIAYMDEGRQRWVAWWARRIYRAVLRKAAK